jgi:uncharacterized RDD family membrane protein YckC
MRLVRAHHIGEALVCPHCATEVSDRVTMRPGRNGPRVRERPMYRDHFLPDLTKRFLGRLIDGLVVSPITFLVVFVFHDNRFGILLGALTLIIYEGSCVALWGQTIGKRVAGTRVISYRSDSLVPSPAQAFTRAAVFASPSLFILLSLPSGAILDQLAFAAIWISILRQRNRRGLTDLVAGTIVVEDL